MIQDATLAPEQLRALFAFPCEPYQQRYVDMFKLMFMMQGVNAVDLLTAAPDAIRDGRFEFSRKKTGVFASILITPEMQEIIDRYRGVDHLLRFCDNGRSYKTFLQHMDRELKKIGPTRHLDNNRKKVTPLFPDLSQYWCRHSWASVASLLDIPKETIRAGLAHSMNVDVDDVYINFDMSKVDAANRRIIDYVIHGK